MAGPVGGFAQGTLPAYSPFPGGDSIHSTPTDARSYSFPVTEEERQWQMYHQQQQRQHQQQSGRAMSYSAFDSMQTTYAHPAPVYAGVPVSPAVGGVPYGLSTLDMQSAQMHQVSGPQSAPVSAPMAPQFDQPVPYGFQPPSGAPGWYHPPSNYGPYGQGSGEGDNAPRRSQQ